MPTTTATVAPPMTDPQAPWWDTVNWWEHAHLAYAKGLADGETDGRRYTSDLKFVGTTTIEPPMVPANPDNTLLPWWDHTPWWSSPQLAWTKGIIDGFDLGVQHELDDLHEAVRAMFTSNPNRAYQDALADHFRTLDARWFRDQWRAAVLAGDYR